MWEMMDDSLDYAVYFESALAGKITANRVLTFFYPTYINITFILTIMQFSKRCFFPHTKYTTKVIISYLYLLAKLRLVSHLLVKQRLISLWLQPIIWRTTRTTENVNTKTVKYPGLRNLVASLPIEMTINIMKFVCGNSLLHDWATTIQFFDTTLITFIEKPKNFKI